MQERNMKNIFNLFQPKINKELDFLIQKTRSSMQNNYKDMAQDYFKEFCNMHDNLVSAESLNDKQLEYYKNERELLTEELKGFTHKDQKPYWH